MIRRFSWVRIIFGVIILLGMIYPASNLVDAATQADQDITNVNLWKYQSVDDPMLFNYMGDRSLRLDSDNNPHIAFGGDHLYYASYDGSNWTFETVDPAVGVGFFTSLALDSQDRPHITYYDTVHGALKYAFFDSVGWNITTLDAYALSANENSANLDASSDASACFVGDRDWRSFPSGLPGEDLGPDAISPHIDLVGYGLYSSIAIDAAGNIHISYYDSVNGNLKYAHTLLNSWIIQTIDFNGDVGAYSSLAVNSSGYGQISYYDKTNGNLKFAHFNGASWVSQTLDTNGDTGQFTSIALGQSQRPAISYYDATLGVLRYIVYNGSTWGPAQTVDRIPKLDNTPRWQ
jgi:hypothetical protein